MQSRRRRQPVASAQGSAGLLDAPLNRPVSINNRFRVGDRFESSFHFQVEREGSVMRWVREIARNVETPARRLIGTSALDDPAGLSEIAGKLENTIDLISAGERASIQKDFARRRFTQQEASGLEP